jgi:hypothetical protein
MASNAWVSAELASQKLKEWRMDQAMGEPSLRLFNPFSPPTSP